MAKKENLNLVLFISYFYRLFRRLTGIPSSWDKKNREER
jgi:hypothetical protein